MSKISSLSSYPLVDSHQLELSIIASYYLRRYLRIQLATRRQLATYSTFEGTTSNSSLLPSKVARSTVAADGLHVHVAIRYYDKYGTKYESTSVQATERSTSVQASTEVLSYNVDIYLRYLAGGGNPGVRYPGKFRPTVHDLSQNTQGFFIQYRFFRFPRVGSQVPRSSGLHSSVFLSYREQLPFFPASKLKSQE